MELFLACLSKGAVILKAIEISLANSSNFKTRNFEISSYKSFDGDIFEASSYTVKGNIIKTFPKKGYEIRFSKKEKGKRKKENIFYSLTIDPLASVSLEQSIKYSIVRRDNVGTVILNSPIPDEVDELKERFLGDILKRIASVYK